MTCQLQSSQGYLRQTLVFIRPLRTVAMVEFVFFRGFFLVMAKLSFGGEDYAPGNNSTNFIKPKVLSLSLTRQGTHI